MLTKRILRAVVVLSVLATAAACAGAGSLLDQGEVETFAPFQPTDEDGNALEQGDPGIPLWSGDTL